MFQAFASEVYDSEEIMKKLLENHAVISATDATKSTGRDDVLAYNLGLDAEEMGIDPKTITDEELFNDEKVFMKNMKIADDYVTKMANKLNVKYSSASAFSCKYDTDSENPAVQCVLSIMYIETARKKQKDIMKKLCDGIE